VSELSNERWGTAPPLAPGSVVAVVVTRHRAAQLADSLASMAKQTHPIAHLVVVDNGPDAPAREVVEACGVPATWLPSWRNLGGAGGFALGMLHALALGADWVWLGDDDGHAADDAVLATLVETADRRGLAAVSPVVVDAAEPDRLAFTVRRGLTWHRSRAGLAADPSVKGDFLPGIAAFFNGALFRAATLEVIGVPDLQLFVRGDEVELHRRMVRSGLPFGTSLTAAYLHPRGLDDLKPMLGGRLHAQHPDDAVKRYYTYRNRGYLVSRPGMRRVGLLEVPRFAWYFLVTRRDPAGFREWVRLLRQGRAERFDRL
jgi:rhamnopyranosyl-N-acetylglucosaminyl-diphospho-decaprenol beta-1,3/1,4-galactofuranosyltransferase